MLQESYSHRSCISLNYGSVRRKNNRKRLLELQMQLRVLFIHSEWFSSHPTAIITSGSDESNIQPQWNRLVNVHNGKCWGKESCYRRAWRLFLSGKIRPNSDFRTYDDVWERKKNSSLSHIRRVQTQSWTFHNSSAPNDGNFIAGNSWCIRFSFLVFEGKELISEQSKKF